MPFSSLNLRLSLVPLLRVKPHLINTLKTVEVEMDAVGLKDILHNLTLKVAGILFDVFENAILLLV